MQMRRLGLRVLLLATASVLLLAVPVAAQDDPYGPTTTTTEPGSPVPTCEVSFEAGVPGATATLILHNAPPGGTVRVIIGGEEAGRGTAPPKGEGASSDLAIPFELPQLDPGTHLVTAVGADFTITCESPEVEVLSSGEVRGDGGGGGSLPRTGIYIGLLLVLAAGLFVAGRAMVETSRRRREPPGRGRQGRGQRDLTRAK